MGSFFKQIYRYSHSRPYRHNENLWPYVKIERAASGEIAVLHYKKQIVPIVELSALKDSCQGPHTVDGHWAISEFHLLWRYS